MAAVREKERDAGEGDGTKGRRFPAMLREVDAGPE